MSSIAKTNFLDALTGWLIAERPAELPAKVTLKDGDLVDLHIIPEHNLDPEKNQRPALLFIASGGSTLHPKLINFELRLENRFNVDDFDEPTVASWQSVLTETLSERSATIQAINAVLISTDSQWTAWDIRAGAPGDSEVEGQRSRDLTDSWTVWMMKN